MRARFLPGEYHPAGRFEQAYRGTLFLDEIGDMPLDVQDLACYACWLTTVLPWARQRRCGCAHYRRHPPETPNDAFRKEIREDPFHRLNVIRIHLPPLRERRGDIPRARRAILQVAAREFRRKPNITSRNRNGVNIVPAWFPATRR